jgi:serine/threonine-protein kinase
MAGAEPKPAPLPPRIGRHQVVGYIATGGMAELFLGKEPSGRPVVIKRILPHLARQASFVSMFVDEARIGSMAKHPNLVEVHELGQVGVDLFLVMEYLVGENLSGLSRRLVKKNERISYGLAAWLIAEVCDGLHAAHELKDPGGNPLQLVHRDVSPQNVFVTYGGDVKLLDFGVATAAHRLTQTASGQVKGKYAYMSPEQCRGEGLDRRSDLFSLGTVLYELTTLRRLFKRPNELQVMKAICDEPIPAPTREIEGYPVSLEQICTRALARDPDQRYSTAAEMREALLAAMQELGLEGDPHEALASKLARLFGDRVAEKRELLTRVREGGDLGELLKAEVDEGVDVPMVSHASATPLSAVRPAGESRATTSPSKHKKKRKARRLALAVLGFAVVAGAGIGYGLRMNGHHAPPPAAPARVAAPTPPPPVQAPKDEDITLSVDTAPQGVHVIVGGEDRGVTPVDVRVKQGTAALSIELRVPGYQSQSHDAVPDKDQKLFFAMLPLQRHPPQPPRHPPQGKGSGSGFHRFD